MRFGGSTLLVGIGGFVGAIARYGLSVALEPRLGGPWPTLAINLLGSFLLGMLTGATRSEAALLLLGVGVLGGFTTFSTFSLQLVGIGGARDWGRLAAYAGLSVVGGVVLAAAGLDAGERLAAALRTGRG